MLSSMFFSKILLYLFIVDFKREVQSSYSSSVVDQFVGLEFGGDDGFAFL